MMHHLYTITGSEAKNRFFDVFFDYVRRLVDIPLSDQENCRMYFEAIHVKKDTILESQDSVHRYHNFIVSGWMRIFHFDHEGREVTTDMNDGPRFMTSYNHFVQRTKSHENLHCVSDCEILRVERDDVDRLAKIGITQQDYAVKILQESIQKSNQRMTDLATLSAEQRYLKLMKEQPSILQNFPLKYIASYLGINPGSLSRIRTARHCDVH